MNERNRRTGTVILVTWSVLCTGVPDPRRSFECVNTYRRIVVNVSAGARSKA